MALGSTQPLGEKSTRNISLGGGGGGVKVAGAYGSQPYHLHVPNFLKSGSLSLLETQGPVQGSTRIALHFLTSTHHTTLAFRIANSLLFTKDPRIRC
jgi:hypothetical protein